MMSWRWIPGITQPQINVADKEYVEVVDLSRLEYSFIIGIKIATRQVEEFAFRNKDFKLIKLLKGIFLIFFFLISRYLSAFAALVESGYDYSSSNPVRGWLHFS